jgi:adenylate cyclase
MAMKLEIERKYLVDSEKLPELGRGSKIVQAYLSIDPSRTIRVRLEDQRAVLCIKVKRGLLTRSEFEYVIPRNDAIELLKTCPTRICKTRYLILVGEKVWEVDVFGGENTGLVTAEVELESEDERVELPIWLTEEVTDKGEYRNAALSLHPFSRWRL